MISKRLKSLIKYVDNKDLVIDIGCDHALLDIELVKKDILDHIIVSDVHEKALDGGIENIKFYKLENKIDARLGNGLSVVNDDDKIDTVLISGMGTSTILNIFDNKYFSNINKLILQSNNDHELLRTSIVKKGFLITDEEYLVDNKKSYINIVFTRGKKNYSKLELKYGPFLIKDKDYLTFELNKCIKIKKLIPNMKLKYQIKMFLDIKILERLIRKCDKNG